MSLALLQESIDEIRRLSLAGSDLAVGDKRLARFQEAYAKAGEKVPVFARIAASLQTLASGNVQQSAENLLAVATLVQAVLYTQGATSVDGELQPIPARSIPIGTHLSFRRVHQILDALQTKGSGRLEILRDAFERGQTRDLRLLRPLLDALGDSYSELAHYVAENILPEFGPALAPILLDEFQIKGGRPHALRLSILAKVARAEHRDLFFEAAENGSKETKLAAIEALGPVPEATPLLETFARKGAKEPSEAALRALAEHFPDRSIPLLIETLNGKTPELAVHAAKMNTAPSWPAALTQYAREFFATLPSKGPPLSEFNRATALLQILNGDARPEIVQCLLELWSNRKKLPINYEESAGKLISSQSLVDDLQLCMTRLHAPETDEALIAAFEQDPGLLDAAFSVCLRRRSPEFVFDRFAPFLTSKKKSERGFILRSLAANTIKRLEILNRYQRSVSVPIPMDPRWKLALSAAGELGLLSQMVDLSDVEELEALRGELRVKKSESRLDAEILENLVALGVPDAIKLTFEVIRKWDKTKSWNFRPFVSVLRSLPASPTEIEALAESLNTKPASEMIVALAAERRAEIASA